MFPTSSLEPINRWRASFPSIENWRASVSLRVLVRERERVALQCSDGNRANIAISDSELRTLHPSLNLPRSPTDIFFGPPSPSQMGNGDLMEYPEIQILKKNINRNLPKLKRTKCQSFLPFYKV